jgi:ketosteroid isomerase-like protein
MDYEMKNLEIICGYDLFLLLFLIDMIRSLLNLSTIFFNHQCFSLYGGNMKHFIVLLIVATQITIIGCTKPVNPEMEKTAVKSVVDQFVKGLETEDIDLIANIMAHDDDMVNFGTDAAERWVGWPVLKESIEKQFASFDSTKLTVRDQVIKVNASGNTAWFSELLDWKMVAQGQPVSLNGSRLTGVLDKRNGNWLCVQFHVSVPESGQAAEY